MLGLRNTFKRIVAALCFFTRLPLWRLAEVEPEHYRHVVPLWPLAGGLTGGVMVLALSQRAAAQLSALIAGQKLQKKYLAVVAGRPAEEAGILRDLLYHDRAKNKSYPVKRMRAGVKEAELDYALMESRDGLSLVRVCLHTGRSHQIRVQFASRGMPLAGDVKYGSAVRDCPIALWSRALSLPHPRTGEALTFSAAPEAVYPWQLFSTIQTEVHHEIS